MLQAIRDKATGWIAWVIVVLLIIPFALWGIQEYFGGGVSVNAVVVNKVEIPRNAFLSKLDQEIRTLKTRPEGKREVAFRKEVLEKMISEELLVQQATESGFRVSDAHLASFIQSTEVFQKDGKFDEDLYRQMLNSNGYSVPMYQQMQSRQMLINQYISGIINSGFITSHESTEAIRLQERTLKLAYFIVPAVMDAADIVASEQDISDYYDKNSARFMVPEQVKVSYLNLDPADMAKEIESSDDELQAMYEEQKGNFRVDDQYQVAHILIGLDAEADEAKSSKAFDKAAGIRKQIDAGGTFSELAKKYSDDAGSANQGGDIGIIEKGSLGKAFEDVAFALKKGEVSEPVKSSSGVHLIKLLDIKPGYEKTFEQVKNELKKQYRRQQVESIFYEQSERLYDLTYENPETLDVAARELGLKISESDWFSRTGGNKGITADRKVINAVFSEDVFAGGDSKRSNNSKLLELKQPKSEELNPVVVLRLLDYKPTRQQTLDEVRTQVSSTVKSRLARDKAYETGNKIADRLKSGEGIDKLATEYKFELKRGDYVRRVDMKHDNRVLSVAFKMQKPGKDKPVNSGFELPDGGYAIVSVTDYRDGKAEDLDEGSSKYLKRLMKNLYSTEEMEALVASLRKNAEITINQDILNLSNEN